MIIVNRLHYVLVDGHLRARPLFNCVQLSRLLTQHLLSKVLLSLLDRQQHFGNLAPSWLLLHDDLAT
jgi:hypothetical protein